MNLDERIAEYLAALRAERGLAEATVAAYRRDLAALAAWLAAQTDRTLLQATEVDLRSYGGERHAATRSSTAKTFLS